MHLGSAHPRKNRSLLLDMLVVLGDKWKGKVCFAGEPLDQHLVLKIQKLGLKDKVISVVKPAHADLLALYSACEVFVLPSFSEGFGWPLIEAQACGAPVIASHMQPLPEVTGGAALHADPHKPEEFAECLIQLQNAQLRRDIIERGFHNCTRFHQESIIKNYIQLHQADDPKIVNAPAIM